MFNSFAIAGKMNKAKQVAKSYSVQSVPLVVVDGKFVVEKRIVNDDSSPSQADLAQPSQGPQARP